tara:strand:- start:3239 stop:3520 length:282 start_codon:yes stop_codon:yes gene_type:complete
MKKVVVIIIVIILALLVGGYYFAKEKAADVVSDRIQEAFGDDVPEGMTVEEYVETIEPEEVPDDICERAAKVPSLAVPDYAREIYNDCINREL